MPALTAPPLASGLYVLPLTGLDGADCAAGDKQKLSDADYRVKTKPGRLCEAYGAS